MHTEAGVAIQNYFSPKGASPTKSQWGTNVDATEDNNTIFQSCLKSRHLDLGEKKLNRLAQEAFTIIVAGGETTARVLTTATFYMVEYKDRILPRLREELRPISESSEGITLKALEQLPWLVSRVDVVRRSTSNNQFRLLSSKSLYASLP
jgi:hypothetical protein